MSRSILVLTCLLAATVASSQPTEPEQHDLILCEGPIAIRDLRGSSRDLADYLSNAHSATHPAAVVLATAMAELSQTLDAQIAAVEPAHGAFAEAWESFDGSVRRSPLPRDPRLRSVLPRYQRGVADLESLLGCAQPAADSELIPCQAIPLAHLLAVVGTDLHGYVEPNYGESYPEQLAAASDLAATATRLHEVLHDLEVAVPGAQGVFRAIEESFAGSSLTDTDDPADLEVKMRLAALREAVASLNAVVGSCHEPAAAHDGH